MSSNFLVEAVVLATIGAIGWTIKNIAVACFLKSNQDKEEQRLKELEDTEELGRGVHMVLTEEAKKEKEKLEATPKKSFADTLFDLVFRNKD